jgi:hypothetical protein
VRCIEIQCRSYENQQHPSACGDFFAHLAG